MFPKACRWNPGVRRLRTNCSTPHLLAETSARQGASVFQIMVEAFAGELRERT